jgi:RHS repeat-associated protein
MITTVAPKPSHSKPTERHEEAHSEFIFDSYSDFTTSNEQITKQMPAQSYVASTNCTSDFCCNQQYSVTAITTAAGAIAERYAYTAYGLPTILNASATIIASSAISNRYTYTGREWDATLGLHHFRARWMSPIAGRFLGRDPIAYQGRTFLLYEYVRAHPLVAFDPSGLLDRRPIDLPKDGKPNPRLPNQRPFIPGRPVPVGPRTPAPSPLACIVVCASISYEVGQRCVRPYVTDPICEWFCPSDLPPTHPDPGRNPSPEPEGSPSPSPDGGQLPPVNPPKQPEDPNAKCWCCDVQTYPSDNSPGGTKNCRSERAADCWAGHPFSKCCHPSTPATPQIADCKEDPRFPFKDKDKWIE